MMIQNYITIYVICLTVLSLSQDFIEEDMEIKEEVTYLA